MQRWSAFCSSPNILGALSAVLVAAAIAALITASSATRCRHRSLLLIWGWSGATIGAVVLFGSASKGAVIAAMAGMAAVLFVAGSARESNLRHIPIKVAFGGVVVAMVLCLWMAPRFMGAVGGDISTVQRWHTWTVSLAVIGDHPFAGIGGGTQALANACTGMLDLPPVLAAHAENICGWALNDVLEIAAKHGLLAAWPVIFVFCAVLLLGLRGVASGSILLGMLAVGICTAWGVAGMFSCVWFYDPVAAGIVWVVIAVLIVALARQTIDCRVRRRVMLLAAAFASVAVIGLWLAGLSIAGGLDRYDEDADGLLLQPRATPLGTLVWLTDQDRSSDVCRFGLRPIVATGWTATTKYPLSGGALARPLIYLLRRPTVEDWARISALPSPDVWVVVDPWSDSQGEPPVGGRSPIIQVIGGATPWLAPATAESSRESVVIVPQLERIWITRFPLAWPLIRHRLHQRMTGHELAGQLQRHL